MNEQDYLFNIDSKVGLASIRDGSVDLVFTDPPYGIANNSKIVKIKGKVISTNDAWGNDFQDCWENIDSYYEWLKPFIAEFVRVLNNNGTMLLFLDRKYTGLITYYLERDFNLNFKNKIYFKKTNPLPSIRKNNYRSTIEECVWLTKGKHHTFNFGEQSEMIQVYQGSIGRKKTNHPTEKYSWMIEPLIKNHSKVGDIILDAFAGSGTIHVLAYKHGRHVIGFENNKEFFDMAKARCVEENIEIAFE